MLSCFLALKRKLDSIGSKTGEPQRSWEGCDAAASMRAVSAAWWLFCVCSAGTVSSQKRAGRQHFSPCPLKYKHCATQAKLAAVS